MSVSVDIQEEYWGEVVDVNDPTKAGRLRVAVMSVFNELSTDKIPWADCKYDSQRQHDLPPLGRIVRVIFENGDLYRPLWFERRGSDTSGLSDDDYASGTVIVNKDLSQYGLDGQLLLCHTKTNGIELKLTRNDNTSTVNVRSDNSVFIQNGNTGKVIHISNDSISIGSEDTSAEPGVLGQTNTDALNQINDFIKELCDNLSKGLDQISSVAGGTPYTMSLVAPISKLKSSIELTKTSWYDKNNQFFEKTKSKIITVD